MNGLMGQLRYFLRYALHQGCCAHAFVKEYYVSKSRTKGVIHA